MADWKPIETAPREQTRILVADKHGRITIGWQFQLVEGGPWRWWAGDGLLTWALTHWQPLPAPPSEGEGKP